MPPVLQAVALVWYVSADLLQAFGIQCCAAATVSFVCHFARS